ncbi:MULTISPECIES: hypothetical protein [unclassified Actinomyces]|uniref:hypothetical protein n=1 Tax=unclassified Actinomyces TaxID=2609248 RepID=UPI002017008D|nr:MULTISPECIES: hypothetical protein [unclassified Actinomyces]MCL3777535.1 hypothetical protein [Actinomyces sp. AC-20-1]MCL3790632.1 hypothetical protein [Actinomyces sp. 187325]MCL3792923.1 hypothetical protein [Actinomyces sp. 186855]MCL3795368.1 hypothetical protein [Actinomyces sp. 217892]
MNDALFPTAEEVTDDLADVTPLFGAAYSEMTKEYARLRREEAGLITRLSKRTVAGILHNLLWSSFSARVAALPRVMAIDEEPVHQVGIGLRYRVRIKRHRPDERIAFYPTRAAMEFWASAQGTFSGLRGCSLAFGYVWDPDLRAPVDAAISLQDGRDGAVWMIRLAPDEDAVHGFSFEHVPPSLPGLDLSAVLWEAAGDEGRDLA